ncbi:hypothetical protein CROQUDRAFT_692781 [Cronartium quercuum f. sp. fusiforme G11]|uniref:DUF7872 domain-containing protein n=1 Tax=Cronartium quercuum f. sp. fusiforme G11 TaxID=708437 RepID=A0A9P6T5Z4_9BASI|nr:hypothetical protein CROQUDRAFT_692781 [Cronartium quercuum f. sp. fusiforme G11]
MKFNFHLQLLIIFWSSVSFHLIRSSITPDLNQITIQSDCQPLPFNKHTWNALNLDHYLSNYPNGKNLTVHEYAIGLNANNFKCGISEWCNAGQMCYPVTGQDWYILFAVQEWNERVNSFHSAVGYTMSLVRASLVKVISSLFPQPNNLHLFSQKTHFELGALIAGLIGSLFTILPFLIGMPSAIFTWFAGLSFIPSTIVIGATVSTRYKATGPVDAFSDWSEISYQVSQYQDILQNAITNRTQLILNSGISTKEGLSGTLSGGEYLDVNLFMSPEKIENKLQNVTLAMSLGQVLKSMNAFVTIGSDPCNGPGPNGAKVGEDVLSYCNSNGTMFNVIRASKGKHPHSINHIPNAIKLSNQFGFTTEYLTQMSIECAGSGGITTSSFNSTTPPADANVKCVISLPVCDCRLDIIKHNKKKLGTVGACIEAGVKI